ncbi:MAG: putative ABC transporter permease [Oscillospiraceae bacterium]|nr:putative ABC transporter permease [Oscillospiraceae bacterium]
MLCNWQGHVVRWLCGGVLYGLLEILWRGHTHWTMMVLAAALCIPLDLANEHMPWALPLWVQAILGGLTITAGELLAGLILNVWLGLDIWDYSTEWGNVLGQICPLYAGLWCLLAGPVIVGFDWLDYWLCGRSCNDRVERSCRIKLCTAARCGCCTIRGERPKYRLL